MPCEIIERFFVDAVRPALNRRVQSASIRLAFKQWCTNRGIDPMSRAMLGRLARWRKEKIGGVVWYLDCELAGGYAVLAPIALAPPVSDGVAATKH